MYPPASHLPPRPVTRSHLHLLFPVSTDEELARRAELERKLTELSDREYDLMMELRRLQNVEL